MEKLKVGISIGDINGIGMEIILKTFGNEDMLKLCTPIIYGSSKVASYHRNIIGEDFNFQQLRDARRPNLDRVNIVNCWTETVNITLGQATEESGQYALRSLEAATNDLREGLIDALVTAPINKEAMQMAGFPFPGHTEYLTENLGSGESLMFLVNEDLRVGLVTNHLPVSEVAAHINKDKIIKKIRMMADSLRIDFGIERPTVAVLGLNPHAGDGGLMGNEEEDIIRPAVVECKKNGLLVMGPYPADGFFGSGSYKKFDGILAMYHDQGLVPFKLLSFGKGVNFTAGLKGVRTSPDHGTAYDIAGKNQADSSSFIQAIFTAIDIARNRKGFYQDRENGLAQNYSKNGLRRKLLEEE